MSAPRIVISGDFLRPGQDGNIGFLWAALRDRVAATFALEPELVLGRPLSWDSWRRARLLGASRYGQAWAGADLVIGFELPPAARNAAANWIDIRRHPLRFDARQVPFSFATSFPTATDGEQFQAQPLTLTLPRVRVMRGYHLDLAIMLQMQADASLLEGEELLRPEDLAPEFAGLVGDKAGVWIVPHPNEPVNAWLAAIQAAIPRARIWEGTAYEAMAAMPWMLTVSSSTGFEAPHFGCTPTFFRPPESPSAPYDLGDLGLWAELSGAFHAHQLSAALP